MPALEAGVLAPEIELQYLDGRKFSLKEQRKKGPVVAVFFKVSCPVCQMALPYLDRISKAYAKSGGFTFVGVSQDNASDTQAFNRQYNIGFPVLLDPVGKYPASNAYKLTHVPSTFLISPEGEIDFATVSWAKADVEQLNRRLASLTNMATAQIFQPGENVSEFKPG
ncbi:MAG TPA: TlpA disulfide reductase family protein [Candidatus Polarisedimenticolia bacterium]|nr:TlpA disulfide reductase family protein [Candidatus Polarisedimenticolia bacterium]